MGIQFNGSTDKVDVTAPLIKQSVNYTIACWAYADSTSAGYHGCIESGSVGYVTFLARNGSDWIFGHKTIGSDRAVTFTGGVTAGVWTHILGVWDGISTITLYVNGVVQGAPDAACTDMYPRAGTTNSIGYLFDASLFFNGRIKDVAMWQEALTPPEIRLLGTGIARPNELRRRLVGYYPFDSNPRAADGIIKTPGVVTGTSFTTDPTLVTPRRAKLFLPYSIIGPPGHRRFTTPFRTSHI